MSSRRSDAEILAQIEAQVMSAGDYVRPTDDLRPKTIEAARQKGSIKRGRRGLVLATLFLILLPNLVALGVRAKGSLLEASVSASELQHDAQSISHQRGLDRGWGLLEAFLGLRREQANCLGVDQQPADKNP